MSFITEVEALAIDRFLSAAIPSFLKRSIFNSRTGIAGLGECRGSMLMCAQDDSGREPYFLSIAELSYCTRSTIQAFSFI